MTDERDALYEMEKAGLRASLKDALRAAFNEGEKHGQTRNAELEAARVKVFALAGDVGAYLYRHEESPYWIEVGGSLLQAIADYDAIAASRP